MIFRSHDFRKKFAEEAGLATYSTYKSVPEAVSWNRRFQIEMDVLAKDNFGRYTYS